MRVLDLLFNRNTFLLFLFLVFAFLYWSCNISLDGVDIGSHVGIVLKTYYDGEVSIPANFLLYALMLFFSKFSDVYFATTCERYITGWFYSKK